MSNSKQDNSGHRERLKEKVRLSIDKGTPFFGLHDYEILEYFLFFMLPRIDTKPLSKKLITHFGSLENVLDASVNELIKIDGIKDKTAYSIVSFRELVNIYKINSIIGSNLELESIKTNIKILFKNKLEENILVISINSKNKIVSSDFITSGNKNKLVFDISKIVKKAVTNNAASLIIAHNHPGGNSEPSNEDIVNTSELKNTLSKSM